MVPFGALFLDDTTQVMDVFDVTYSPSIGIHKILQQKKKNSPSPSFGGKNILLVGNPTNSAIPDIEDLPSALKEAQDLARLLSPTNRVTLLTESTPTIERVKAEMKDSHVIHFACHCFYEPSKDTNEMIKKNRYLVLTPSSAHPEGKLYHSIVEEVELSNHPLVVLSACSTADGHICSDGVVGLIRGFLVAGASRVIASLYPINDHITMKIMTRWYNRMHQEPEKDPITLFHQERFVTKRKKGLL